MPRSTKKNNGSSEVMDLFSSLGDDNDDGDDGATPRLRPQAVTAPPATGEAQVPVQQAAVQHAAEATAGAASASPGRSSSRKRRGLSAQDMAAKQREISISEFFAKNRHLLGFDNPTKALLTTIKEAVDNSLDACEEADILPDIWVEVVRITEERYRVAVEDNGPGIVKAQIPKIFGKLLYGSKFHAMKQTRGQQGIGISAAAMYGQLTTGKAVRITSRTGRGKPAYFYELHIDTQRNKPEIMNGDGEEVEWENEHGTRVEIELEARYVKGRRSVDDYLEQTAIANPHARLVYTSPDNETRTFERTADDMPPEPKEIKPHPYGVELGILMKMLKETHARGVAAFLQQEFSRVSGKVAKDICTAAKLSEKAYCSKVGREEADALYQAIQQTKIMSPPTNCLSPIGDALIEASLRQEVTGDFYAAVTRAPSVYRGNPFQIEVGLTWGGQRPADEAVTLLRFANRVPLQYLQSACAVTRAVLSLDWKNYGLQQARGALPSGPMTLMVHMASVWVPFTSESKEAIAHYPEILKEIKLALQECGRKLGSHIRRRKRDAEESKKRSYITKYLPHVVIALQEILTLDDRAAGTTAGNLEVILERTRGKKPGSGDKDGGGSPAPAGPQADADDDDGPAPLAEAG